MKIEELRFKAEYDADQTVLNWLAMHPKAKITKRHPVKILPPQMVSCRPFRPIEAKDQYSILIEYEEP